MPGSSAAKTPPKKRSTARRDRNLQGWAADEGHPLHSSLSGGGVWGYLVAHADKPDSAEWKAGFSYLAAHAGAVLASHPPEAAHGKLFHALLCLPAVGASEDALLEAGLAHIASGLGLASSTTATWTPDERARAAPAARELLAHLRMGSLSVRAVLRAVEPLQIVSDEDLLSFYRGAALSKAEGELRAMLRIIESEHPYSPDENGTVDEVRVEGGCTAALLEFDRRCEILPGAELLFFADAEGRKEIARWGSEWPWRRKGVRYLVIDMPVFFVEFRCAAGVETGWGWKMQVTPMRGKTDSDEE